jgi:hypothetical protein
MTGATPDLIAGVQALEGERDRYLARWRYYAGDLPERFASDQIAAFMARATPDTQYRFRLAKVPITAMRNRVRLASVTGPSDAVSAKIEQIRDANRMELVEPFTIERQMVYGDAYMITWPVDSEDESVPPEVREAGVEIRYQSPLTTRAMYDAEDGTRLRYVIRRWKTTDPIGTWRWHAELFYPDGRIEPWICQEGATGLQAESWSRDLDAPDVDPDGYVWHEWGMPIHHARNALPYGVPEHADAFGPQDAFTKLVMTQATELDGHSLPERYEIIKATNPDTARDSVQWPDDAEAPDAKPLRSGSGRRRGPGTVSILEGRDGTGEYRAPNPSELVPTSDSWLGMMAVVTQTPAYEYDPTRNAGLSGIARMWADRPLDQREKTAKLFLAGFFESVWRTALDMAGVGRDITVSIEWAAPGVINDPDWWQVATVRREHGVPQDVILREANYAPEDVQAWLDDQDNEARSLLERITMLEKLGLALQAIGSAVALGGIDQARVDAFVSKILGESVIEPEPVSEPAQEVTVDAADPVPATAR